MGTLKEIGYSQYLSFLNKDELTILKHDIDEFIDKNNVYETKVNPSHTYTSMRIQNKTIINKRFKSRDGDEGLIDIYNIDASLSKESQNIINKIITIKEIEKKNILEIGPGTGNLTAKILEKKPKKFLVIEKDNELANILQKKFNNKIQIINDDILEIEENSLSDETLTVYGNLPYNISTEILSKWILNINSKKIWRILKRD